MKTLIFALIFSSMAHAAGPAAQPELLSDTEISNKIISSARDLENQRILEGIPDFQTCKQRFQFQKGENTDALRQRSALQATQCFKDALQGKNSPEEIGVIADKLNLQAYKLIPSKSVQEITKYLSNKMYKSLTGIDYEESDAKKRIESLKFNKTKKIVDQKQFIELYKSQIAKNILSEVTRFCFEDFRLEGAPSNDSFSAHWAAYITAGNWNDAVATPAGSTTPAPGVKDTGTPFGTASQTREDKDAAYQGIINSTFPGTIPSAAILSGFFFFCGKQINTLCTEFEKTTKADGTTPAGSDKTGARACLTKSRLVSFKKAMKASDQIIADFNANGGGNAFRLLDDPNEVVKAFGSGQNGEKSLNEITNNASIDFFKATESEDTQKAQNCLTGGGASCDDFVIVDDSREKIQYNVEIEYSAKREAEMARVRALVRGDRQNLIEYLKTNGYMKLAEQVETGTIPPDFDKEIGKIWEARKIALQEEIQNRLGTRQITETEAAAQAPNGTDTVKVANAKENAKQTLNERARLSRVIFFNNIISSNLRLIEAGSNREVGRNTQALRNELSSLDGQVDGSIFENLQRTLPSGDSSGGQNRGPTGREEISDISFIDQFLGAKEPAQPAGGATPGN
ncbi:MAG: hypothetical protein V4598_15990 [Bdellovibrionota bacterium]